MAFFVENILQNIWKCCKNFSIFEETKKEILGEYLLNKNIIL